MKLYELLEFASWKDVQEALTRFYHTGESEDDSWPEFKGVFGELLSAEPKDSETEITVVPNFVKEDMMGVRVIGDGGKAGSDPVFGLSMTPWVEWLGMRVDDDICESFSAAEIIALCLFEMTYLGYDMRKVNEMIGSINHVPIPKIRKKKGTASPLLDLKHAGKNDLMWKRLNLGKKGEKEE